MMLYRRCDRCGQDIHDRYVVLSKESGIEPMREPSGAITIRTDLCAACVQSFQTWLSHVFHANEQRMANDSRG